MTLNIKPANIFLFFILFLSSNIIFSYKRVKCDLCHKFIVKNRIKRHKQLYCLGNPNTGKECEFCKIYFFNLIEHHKNCKSRTSDKQCPSCNEYFSDKYSLKRHIKHFHPEKKYLPEEEIYKRKIKKNKPKKITKPIQGISAIAGNLRKKQILNSARKNAAQQKQPDFNPSLLIFPQNFGGVSKKPNTQIHNGNQNNNDDLELSLSIPSTFSNKNNICFVTNWIENHEKICYERPNKTPRVKCSFCGKPFVSKWIKQHEKICNENPNKTPKVECSFCEGLFTKLWIENHEEKCKKKHKKTPKNDYLYEKNDENNNDYLLDEESYNKVNNQKTIHSLQLITPITQDVTIPLDLSENTKTNDLQQEQPENDMSPISINDYLPSTAKEYQEKDNNLLQENKLSLDNNDDNFDITFDVDEYINSMVSEIPLDDQPPTLED